MICAKDLPRHLNECALISVATSLGSSTLRLLLKHNLISGLGDQDKAGVIE